MTPPKRRLAIVVKGWPRLSETFIAQELLALETAGVDFDIWSLRHPTDVKRHPLHARIQAKVFYLPEYLKQEPWRVLRGLWHAMRLPGFSAAFRTFRQDYARDRTPNRVRRFGQACVLARELPEDVAGLYAHFLHTPSSVARYCAILRGLPWSFSAHAKDIWTSPEWEIREKLAPDHFGATFGATCTATGADYLRSLAKRPACIDLVYHGLDLSRFPAPPQRQWRSPGTPLALMSVGRLVEKKGFDRLIDALQLLPKGLDWHWTHIGGGELKEQMEQHAAAHGLSDRISWRGACDQPEVIADMRRADLFVLPSRVASNGDRDGLPNVLMEAASQMLPILSTPVSAIPEFIDDGVHGVLVDDSPDSLCRAICAFEAREDAGQPLAQAAYERLVGEFSMAPGIATLAKRLTSMTSDAA
jgi:glycosyltransferase involved in cell wall biosynthesis